VPHPNAYVGRFAPSPSARLHAGSLVAAVASYLDARAQHGSWLVRIEDVDEARSAPGADQAILSLLQTLGMQWDGDVVWQSRRKELYQAAFERLAVHTYPCGCNRREIADSRLGLAPDGAAIYPGTCRHGLAMGKAARSLRVRVPDAGDGDAIAFTDRFAGTVVQHLARESGDFVLKRADGFWAYQLAVVVDDAEQGVTDVVRGADLLDSTPRQIYLQRLLGLPTPRYLHVPVVRDANGEKLSKQSGALAVTPGDEAAGLAALQGAASFLGLPVLGADSVARFWQAAIPAWAELLARRGAAVAGGQACAQSMP
jgi:glutamyl-Q tRNA(Asp) synthetase